MSVKTTNGQSPAPLTAPGPERHGRSGQSRQRMQVTTVVALVIAVLLAFSFVLPIGSIFGHAFSAAGVASLTSLFTTTYGRELLIHTLVLGSLVGLIGTAVAFLMAYVHVRIKIPGKRILHFLSLLPVVSPPFAAAMSLIILVGTNGIFTRTFGIDIHLYGLTGMTASLVLAFFPVSYINLIGMLQHLDRSLDEAALSLGATPFSRFIKVTLPLMMPGLVASFLLFFVESLADLANPLVIGGSYDVLAKSVYQAVTTTADFDTAAGYALGLLIPGVLIFLIQRHWVTKRDVASVTGKPAGEIEVIKHGKSRVILGALAYIIGAIVIAVYLVIFLGGFVQYIGVDNTFTLANFHYVLFGVGLQPVRTTTILALIAAPLATVIGLLIAWLSIRHLRRLGGILDLLGMLGIAAPGVVIGIGYALAFGHSYSVGGHEVLPILATGGAVLGGQLALVMIFTVRSIPAALRAGSSSIAQLDSSIEEAATDLGATSFQTWRKVTLPLIRPAIMSGATYAIARSMTTFSPVIFITTANLLVISVAINNEVSAARYGIAFAYCSILILIVLIAIGIINIFNGRRSKKTGNATIMLAANRPESEVL
ncbi:MAG: iron ABC transporter permease [Nakamurella sp.]